MNAAVRKGSIDRRDAVLVIAYLMTAFAALLIGGIAGLLQGMTRGMNIPLPFGMSYYQLLTAHGVLMALIFTTYFIIGFLLAVCSKSLGGELPSPTRAMSWFGFGLMTAGTVLGTVLILQDKATVLYTFYAPMQASPWFYIALVLIVAGSWLPAFAVFCCLRVWKRRNPGKTTPLLVFMAVVIMALWMVATLGVAFEVIVQLIPWSFGWVERVHVLLSRTLFWYFGHPLVYFWLLPAYMCWYVVIPKVIGGRIFSDALARLSFLLFLIFSVPVGFHHQLMEPGITSFWKYIQVVLTFMVIIPTFMTAFSVFAVFELRGRELGATGLFGWFRKMPWRDVRFFAPFMGMLVFIPAGAGGIINASNQMNAVVHNTLWVTGHLHLTVATTVALTFFGITYWLIPSILGKELTPRMHGLGIIQTVIWLVGMLFMSGSMHTAGLLGSPRRTAYTTYDGHPDSVLWMPYYVAMAIGGTILFIGVLLMIANVIQLLAAPHGNTEFPVAEPAADAVPAPRLFERWGLWMTVVVLLILVAYAVPVMDMVMNPVPGSPPVVTW